MATPLSTLVQRTRRYLRDWKDFDTITASLAASGTSVSVADSSIYAKRWPVEIDQELMQIRSIDSSVSFTVERGAFGSTAATHTNGSNVLIRPDYYAIEIIDAINEAILATFPAIYMPVVDTSATIATNTYTYSVPDCPGRTGWPIPYVYRVEVLQPGDYTFRRTRRFEIIRGASTSASTVTTASSSVSPAIKFKSLPPVGSTLRISGYGPFPALSNLTDTLHMMFPPQAEYLLPIYAAGSLLMSGEAGRVRLDAGAVDQREQANRVGASLQIGGALLNRFRSELLQGGAASALPPLPRHARSTI